MHRDQAIEIFMIPKEEVEKDLRHLAKNKFVFSQFYGDWYRANAKSLWPLIQNHPIHKHLYKMGIRTYSDFERHMREVETKFWQKLAVMKSWWGTIEGFYHKHGYTWSFFGFRRNGYMGRNAIINAPTQGTAFHCLLWSANMIRRVMKKEQWKTKMIGQIHDAIVFDVCPSELDHVKKVVQDIMCERIRDEFSWIIVPLAVEFSFYNTSWYDEFKETDEDFELLLEENK
jgi:DNA polymerase I-like protein with 3'-5' exonuclease and polymerase domains